MDEEEAILMVELKGLPNPDLIHKCINVSILGVDTPEPILQLDSNVFRGVYEDIPGTFMIFAPTDGEQQLSYLCKTSKKLSMTKVILQEKTSQHQDEGPSSDHPNETTQ
ncbi:hypothetical protein EMCRGX_G002707 [Ephydatia muelleri]|eukprot:Em0001g2524a